MNFYFKHKKRLIVFSMISFLMFCINASASDCGVLRLQNNRSNRINVRENKCKEPPNISIGTLIDISAQGRLWLKSNQSPIIDSEFQMICQNESRRPIQLEFSDMVTPWLNQTKLNNCSGWINNKLSCKAKKGESNGIFCVLAFNQSLANNEAGHVERTTSVKIRGLNSSLQSENVSMSNGKEKTLDAIKPELILCKQLNRITSDIKVSWNVNKNTEVKHIDVGLTEKLNDYALSECIESVITTFQYPAFSEAIDFKLEF